MVKETEENEEKNNFLPRLVEGKDDSKPGIMPSKNNALC